MTDYLQNLRIVMPVKTGIQALWIPAFAGMTKNESANLPQCQKKKKIYFRCFSFVIFVRFVVKKSYD